VVDASSVRGVRKLVSLFETCEETIGTVEWSDHLVSLAFLEVCHFGDLTKSRVSELSARNDAAVGNAIGN
jgi:hypothetical protein